MVKSVCEMSCEKYRKIYATLSQKQYKYTLQGVNPQNNTFNLKKKT